MLALRLVTWATSIAKKKSFFLHLYNATTVFPNCLHSFFLNFWRHNRIIYWINHNHIQIFFVMVIHYALCTECMDIILFFFFINKFVTSNCVFLKRICPKKLYCFHIVLMEASDFEARLTWSIFKVRAGVKRQSSKAPAKTSILMSGGKYTLCPAVYPSQSSIFNFL